jgi:hypothetical protein
VISIVTKRGTNIWKGGASVYYAPESLQASGKDVASLDPDAVTHSGKPGQSVYRKLNKDTDLSANVYMGGPIIKDKLFFFGVVEGRHDTIDRFGRATSRTEKSTHPNGMIKLDFTPNDSHRLEFTGITNKVKTDIVDYNVPVLDDGTGDEYVTGHVGVPGVSQVTSGGHTLIAKYTGYVTDNLTLSVLAGSVEDKVAKTTGARQAGQDCPAVLALSGAFVGCWSLDFPGSVRDFTKPDDKDTRKAFRIDAEYVLGDHTIRAGIDNQKFTSAAAGSLTYSGGEYFRYFRSATGTVNGVANAVPVNGTYVRRRTGLSTSGEFEVLNEAYYLEDSWKATKSVLLYGGLRWKSFDNKNGDGVSFVKADKLFAPRLGAAWDVFGDSQMKVFGNVGRYYIPVASNTNIRATRGEASTESYYTYTGIDPRTQGPTGLSAPIGTSLVVGDGTSPNPATIADTQLKPMSQDEFILGVEKNFAGSWKMGVKGTHRKINNGMDDYCSHLAFENYAADKGYTNFDSSTMAQCIMVNPGNDVTLQVDLQNDGKLSTVVFPASYIGLEKYTRTYDAIELSLERPFDGKWGIQGSYTWSKTKGTAEGYVNSVINQEDAGVS